MDHIRKSGVLAHITSLPSTYGIGDFGPQAFSFVEYLRESRQKYWQILPLNPTGYGNSPYQSNSCFAGNPLLISPQMLVKNGYLSDYDISNPPEFDTCKVEYDKVNKYKSHLFQIAYKNFLSLEREPAEYKQFCKKNSWLEDYALFMSIKSFLTSKRDAEANLSTYAATQAFLSDILDDDTFEEAYSSAMWFTWPNELRERKKPALDEYMTLLKTDIKYYKFLQFLFFSQWKKLKDYANKLGIEIIGDLPIFVSMDSSDYWANKHLFLTDECGFPAFVSGVPPDYFSDTGQLWGNPLYDFKAQESDGYKWWVERFSHTLFMADIVRVDHFRGFAAFWQVPRGEKTAINGKWVKGPGKKLFHAAQEKLGPLPIIAEDLGIITPDVTTLRKGLKYPGMKILQFAFQDDNQNSYLPHNYTDNHTVVYTGTHDNDTTLGWYKSRSEKEQDYVRKYMNISGKDISWDLIRLAFGSTADTVIIPIQDLMGLDGESRMNRPGVAEGNWEFRFTDDMLTDGISDGLKYLCSLYNR